MTYHFPRSPAPTSGKVSGKVTPVIAFSAPARATEKAKRDKAMLAGAKADLAPDLPHRNRKQVLQITRSRRGEIDTKARQQLLEQPFFPLA